MTPTDLLVAFTGAILSNGKINSRWRAKFKDQGQAILDFVPDAESIAEAIYRLSTNTDRPVCLTCGGKVNFSASKNVGYGRFCSSSCGQRDPQVQQAKIETNIVRYGVPNVGAFGGERHKAAMVAKYGVEHPMSSDEIKGRLEATNLEKYGTTNVFAATEIKERIKSTVVDRYGVDHVMQVPSIKEKYRNENGEWKPAVINVEVRLKNALITNTEKIRKRLQDNQFELLSLPTGFSSKHLHLIKHLVCNTEFEGIVYSGNIPRCFTCEPKLVGTSKLQQRVEEFVETLGIEFYTDRKILDGKEIDIYIPSHQIGFEVNGLYPHSELAYNGNGHDKAYHLNKTTKAASKEVRLIHLFEDDIRNRWEVVQSMIRSALQLNNTIFARNCVVQEVPSREAKTFCDENHLKRSARFTYAVGLYYQHELVVCATFSSPRYDKQTKKKKKQQELEFDHELIRFCTQLDLNVAGGLSKIIRFFEEQKNPIGLLSYADRAYSTGNAYLKCGFTLKRTTAPSYWYFKNNDNIRHHPTQLRKYKLKRLYDDLDMKQTEWQLLQERGWNRIWDCGQLVFVKQNTRRS